MSFLLIVLLLAIITALSLLVGIGLIWWKRTRPLGLYALTVEPGSVVGLVLAGWMWMKFYRPPIPVQEHEWMVWVTLAFMLLWFCGMSAVGALLGFVLATWIWWRFSPQPYFPILKDGYLNAVKSIGMWHRQRWGKAKSLK